MDYFIVKMSPSTYHVNTHIIWSRLTLNHGDETSDLVDITGNLYIPLLTDIDMHSVEDTDR